MRIDPRVSTRVTESSPVYKNRRFGDNAWESFRVTIISRFNLRAPRERRYFIHLDFVDFRKQSRARRKPNRDFRQGERKVP